MTTKDSQQEDTSVEQLPPPISDYVYPDLSSFPALKNDLILRSANSENPLSLPKIPVWVMRQAGRYLPEFLEVRKEHSFFTVCRTPELACEVTLQPIRRYSGLLDASIIFSDILVVPQAMGMEVQMLKGIGPSFPQPLRDPQDASERILSKTTDVEKELSYVFAAITLTRQKLGGEVPLIGFCAAAWTLFGYMVEGGGSKTWEKTKAWLYKDPENAKAVLEKITQVSAEYLVGQVRAGAQMLQVFDTNADCLTPTGFNTFILPYLIALPKLVKAQLSKHQIPCPPMTVFAKGTNAPDQLKALSEAGYETVGVDWGVTPRNARLLTQQKVALQGNLDPPVLHAPKEVLKKQVRELVWGKDGFLTIAKEGLKGGWIANLGHGITPSVNPENMRYFLERIKVETSKKSADEPEK